MSGPGSEWDGPRTRYEITVAGDDDVLDAVAAAVRGWALPHGRRFFMWRALPMTPDPVTPQGSAEPGTARLDALWDELWVVAKQRTRSGRPVWEIRADIEAEARAAAPQAADAGLREALVEEIIGLGPSLNTRVRIEEAVVALRSRWSIETRHDELNLAEPAARAEGLEPEGSMARPMNPEGSRTPLSGLPEIDVERLRVAWGYLEAELDDIPEGSPIHDIADDICVLLGDEHADELIGADPRNTLTRIAGNEVAEMAETAWLIEAGQPEGIDPPQWWTGLTNPATRPVGWTSDAWKAERFATREDAEAEISRRERFFHLRDTWGRAVEHVFRAAATPEAEGGDAE